MLSVTITVLLFKQRYFAFQNIESHSCICKNVCHVLIYESGLREGMVIVMKLKFVDSVSLEMILREKLTSLIAEYMTCCLNGKLLALQRSSNLVNESVGCLH